MIRESQDVEFFDDRRLTQRIANHFGAPGTSMYDVVPVPQPWPSLGLTGTTEEYGMFPLEIGEKKLLSPEQLRIGGGGSIAALHAHLDKYKTFLIHLNNPAEGSSRASKEWQKNHWYHRPGNRHSQTYDSMHYDSRLKINTNVHLVHDVLVLYGLMRRPIFRFLFETNPFVIAQDHIVRLDIYWTGRDCIGYMKHILHSHGVSCSIKEIVQQSKQGSVYRGIYENELHKNLGPEQCDPILHGKST